MSDLDLRAQFEENVAEIKKIDELLDSLTGGKAAGKRKMKNDLVEKHSDDPFMKNREQIVNGVRGIEDDETRYAVVLGILDSLNSEFGSAVDSFVTAKVEAQPKQEALITEEQADQLMKDRTNLRNQTKSMAELAEALLQEEWEVPAGRHGGVGKRKPANLSLFEWEVNGEAPVDDDGEPLSYREIATANGYAKVGEFTKALKAANIDPSSVSKIEDWKMPNGSVLSGWNPNASKDEEEGEEEESDED